MSDLVVSIALPTYNGVKYIDQAIQSCIDQTYIHWELIIVDDASTDNTGDIAKKWAETDPRIRYIRHETNKNLPSALNTAIANMTGDYFTWVSDDDLFRPRALEEMINFLENNPEFDLVFTDYSEISPVGEIIRRITVGDPNDLGIHNMIGVCHLRRKKVLDTVGGYSEDVFLVEDLDFWIRAAIDFKIAPYHEDLFLYRQHPSSLTSQSGKRVYPIHAEVLERYSARMHWMTPDKWAYAYLRLAKKAALVKDIANVSRYTLRAIQYSPTYFIRKIFSKAVSIIRTGKHDTPTSPVEH